MTYLPMGKNRKERALEKKLMKMGWKRSSHQHYAKMVTGQEVAIDEHIGHFCVGIYRNNRAVGQNERPKRFDQAYAAALALEEKLSG